LFVDNKDLDSYSKENIFTHLKDKFLDFVDSEGNDDEENKIGNERMEDIKYPKQYQQQSENEKEFNKKKMKNCLYLMKRKKQITVYTKIIIMKC